MGLGPSPGDVGPSGLRAGARMPHYPPEETVSRAAAEKV